jgi:glycosyltransferase involved in cell wall biosynthesis
MVQLNIQLHHGLKINIIFKKNMKLNFKKKKLPRILCFVSHYLPGYKSGGPVKSIHNLTEHLSKDFEFLIVTSDRDLKDKNPYKTIKINQWNKVGKAKVFYASNFFMTIVGILKLLRITKFDVIYLNSFFNLKFTIIPLILWKLFLKSRIPCILTPRGEFSSEALNIKLLKKKFYIFVSNFFGLLNKVNWQASCKNEYKDILKNLSINSKSIKIAPDLPKKYQNLKNITLKKNKTKNENLKIIFLSRISPMKNLDFLIKVLEKVKNKVLLNIYGPIEDKDYWKKCKNLISNQPLNVRIVYRGVALPNKVNSIFSKHHLFILPSRGESYGHVVAESLTVGTPVLISNKTPWKKLKNSIIVFSLKDMKKWTKEIEKWADFDDDNLLKRKLSTIKFAKKYLSSTESVKKNKNLFLSFIN